MLTDTLGVAIAFITVILLLSIIVTALVQATQALLRVRGRNLMKGLAKLILKARAGTDLAGDETAARKDASRILNAGNVALINQVKDPTSLLHYWILGPKISWLEPGQLPAAIGEQVKDLKDKVAELTEDFERAQQMLQKRFQRHIRACTLFWAVVVAIAYQVSAPALLSRIQENPVIRAQIEAGAGKTLAYAGEALEKLDYEGAAAEALEELKQKYEEKGNQTVVARLEEASGVGVGRDFIVDELALVVEGLPEADEIVEEYKQLLDEKATARMEELREIQQGAEAQLTDYGITLWRQGAGFYYNSEQSDIRWDRLFGVLVTAILLSLGAPFWFERLRDVVQLRDLLSPAARRPTAGGAPPPSDETRTGRGGRSPGEDEERPG